MIKADATGDERINAKEMLLLLSTFDTAAINKMACGRCRCWR